MTKKLVAKMWGQADKGQVSRASDDCIQVEVYYRTEGDALLAVYLTVELKSGSTVPEVRVHVGQTVSYAPYQ